MANSGYNRFVRLFLGKTLAVASDGDTKGQSPFREKKTLTEGFSNAFSNSVFCRAFLPKKRV
jgi:hypothetical protein